MRRLPPLLACLSMMSLALADPIHAVADGGYWHHDSNWIFPERIGEFTRVGIPQDVAGSPDAVAWYARGENEARITASVDVHPKDSALSAVTLADAKARLEKELGAAAIPTEESFAVGNAGTFTGTRVVFRTSATGALTALYFVMAHEWRVSIRVNVPITVPQTLPTLDEFVRGQRWDTLARR